MQGRRDLYILRGRLMNPTEAKSSKNHAVPHMTANMTLQHDNTKPHTIRRARCSSVVRAFAHGAMGRRIGPSWGGPIELFLVPASAPRLV